MKDNGNNRPAGWLRRDFLSTTLAGAAALSLKSIGLPGPVSAQELDEINWPDKIRTKLASRLMRLHHFMWHTVRNTWYKVGENALARIQQDYPLWVPPRPSLIYPVWDKDTDRRGTRWATTTGAGVDFIYMHRQMIRMLDEWLAELGMKVVPWNGDSIPAPVPASYPPTRHEKVPEAWTHPSARFSTRLKQLKSDAFYYDQMSWWDRSYKDYSHLKTLTLGELGARMEIDVHNSMHIRWSAQPINPQKREYAPGGRPHDDIPITNEDWDSPLYDTLLDEYSSHMTRNFWRIHKWIDNRIHDWAEAHGGKVQTIERDGVSWYASGDWVEEAAENPWVGPFVPGDESNLDGKIKVMESVFNIMAERDQAGVLRAGGESPVRMIGLEELAIRR